MGSPVCATMRNFVAAGWRKSVSRPQTGSTLRAITHVARNIRPAQSKSVSSLAPRTQRVLRPCTVRHSSSTVVVPEMGESITEGTVSEILKGPGDVVAEDEVILQIETDKVTVDVVAPAAGRIVSFACAEEDNVEVGAELFHFEADPNAVAPAAPAAEAAKEAPVAAATPAAAAAPAASPAAAATEEPVGAGPVRTQFSTPLSRMRIRSQERLKASQNAAACLTTYNEINMQEFITVRANYNDMFEKKHGVGLGFMSGFVKAATAALMNEKSVNSSILGEQQVFYEYADIGIATATEHGLVVPILRDCQDMNFADTEKAISELGAKARSGTMAIEDMAGGTFTIANGGVFGSLMGMPMLKAPQSAVLGLHGIHERPVFVDNKVQLQPMMYVALTYDHRIIDGREAVTFLKNVKELMEDPRRMLLNV